MAGRARRAKRGGKQICPRHTFLACLARNIVFRCAEGPRAHLDARRPCPHKERYRVPLTEALVFLCTGAPVDVLDPCVAGEFAVPFISPAIRMRVSCLLSIWNAWPRLTKNSDNSSAAPIESKAKFLHAMHLLIFGTLTRLLAYV